MTICRMTPRGSVSCRRTNADIDRRNRCTLPRIGRSSRSCPVRRRRQAISISSGARYDQCAVQPTRGIARLAGWVERRGTLLPFAGIGLWFAAANVLAVLFRPDTHALVDDWAAHLRWLGLFLAGVLLAKSGVWSELEARRRSLARAAFAALAAFLALRYGLRVGIAPEVWIKPAYGSAAAIFGWITILALCGVAKAWLDRPSPLLSYLNRAILPFYVLHQTVLILLAVALFACELPVLAEIPLLFTLTLTASWLIYELVIRKSRLLAPLFGLDAGPRGKRLSV